MKFKCKVSPKGMITVGGVVHKANAGFIETQGNKALEKALDDNHYWERVKEQGKTDEQKAAAALAKKEEIAAKKAAAALAKKDAKNNKKEGAKK